jgi:ribosomal protein L13E
MIREIAYQRESPSQKSWELGIPVDIRRTETSVELFEPGIASF